MARSAYAVRHPRRARAGGPDVFEIQFTAYGFGWVVVHLDGVDRDELAELVFEAWRLSAPAALLERRGERLPV